MWQADVPAMVQVSELLGLAIERLTAKRVGAAKFRVCGGCARGSVEPYIREPPRSCKDRVAGDTNDGLAMLWW